MNCSNSLHPSSQRPSNTWKEPGKNLFLDKKEIFNKDELKWSQQQHNVAPALKLLSEILSKCCQQKQNVAPAMKLL